MGKIIRNGECYGGGNLEDITGGIKIETGYVTGGNLDTSTTTISGTYVLIFAWYGASNVGAIYGCNSDNVVVLTSDTSTISVTASGTTYTFTSTATSSGSRLRYIAIIVS